MTNLEKATEFVKLVNELNDVTVRLSKFTLENHEDLNDPEITTHIVSDHKTIDSNYKAYQFLYEIHVQFEDLYNLFVEPDLKWYQFITERIKKFIKDYE